MTGQLEMADRAVTALLQNFIGYGAFISIKIDFIQYMYLVAHYNPQEPEWGVHGSNHIS